MSLDNIVRLVTGRLSLREPQGESLRKASWLQRYGHRRLGDAFALDNVNIGTRCCPCRTCR